MDRVGGYAAYCALEADGRAYEDVIIAMNAEAQVQKREAKRRRA